MKHLIAIVAFTVLSTNSAFAFRINGIVSDKQDETSIAGKKVVIGEVEQFELINFPKSNFGKVMIEEEDRLAVSYGVQRDRIVTNANSYVMYMYALLLPLSLC